MLESKSNQGIQRDDSIYGVTIILLHWLRNNTYVKDYTNQCTHRFTLLEAGMTFL